MIIINRSKKTNLSQDRYQNSLIECLKLLKSSLWDMLNIYKIILNVILSLTQFSYSCCFSYLLFLSPVSHEFRQRDSMEKEFILNTSIKFNFCRILEYIQFVLLEVVLPKQCLGTTSDTQTVMLGEGCMWCQRSNQDLT